MKANLIRYLKEYGGKTFQECPFSEVDALLFASLSYLKMQGIVPGFRKGEGVRWTEMAQHPEVEKMFTDPLYGKQHRRVFYLVLGSRRYRSVRVNYYKEWFDEGREAQFAAVTFLLGPTSVFVSFRGTDETLVGWKEDFNMSCMREVPSQHSALAYLKGVARFTDGRMILGGHSKGGNLAVYAAAYAPKQIQRRIRRIYSFDGPGFRRGFYEKPGFMQMEDRLCKIMPEQSLIGGLFVNYRKYRVIESYKRSSIWQHDLMQWKIRSGRFVYCKKLGKRSIRKTLVFNSWINSLSRRQRSEFVNTLYKLLRDTHVSDVGELFKKPVSILGGVLAGLFRLERERRQLFLHTIGRLFQAAVRQFGR